MRFNIGPLFFFFFLTIFELQTGSSVLSALKGRIHYFKLDGDTILELYFHFDFFFSSSESRMTRLRFTIMLRQSHSTVICRIHPAAVCALWVKTGLKCNVSLPSPSPQPPPPPLPNLLDSLIPLSVKVVPSLSNVGPPREHWNMMLSLSDHLWKAKKATKTKLK